MTPISSEIPIPVAPVGPGLSPAAPTAVASKHTYGQILKSSALIGGSSVLKIGIGIVRTKAMALLLGPAGVGFIGLYNSILDLTQNITGMGINSSGVRQIAEAVGSGKTEKIARTTVVLRRTAIVLGVLGAILLAVFSKQVSRLTFGNDQHTTAVALLSLAVFFGSVSGGQGALIQGMRRISDLAKMGVLGALFGTVVSIVLVYFFREQGIVPSLVSVAAMAILTSWWYSRKVQVQALALTMSELWQEASALLKLGLAFMAGSVLIMGAAYVIRLFIVRRVSLEAAGLYQSAWALGGLYVGIILQAMGADFYPRLTAVSNDHPECNRLVNEQAQISLLLAGPGVIATLTFAPLVIALFYSAKFNEAVPVLRWICLGATLQVITWPMGFIVVAKGRQNLFLVCELAYTLVYLGVAWLCITHYGLAGAGMAFFGSYVFHAFLIYPCVRWLTGFRWSVANRKTGIVFLTSIALVFGSFYVLPFWLATTVGSLTALGSGIYSIRTLTHLIPMDRTPRPIRQLLVWLRLAPSGII